MPSFGESHQYCADTMHIYGHRFIREGKTAISHDGALTHMDLRHASAVTSAFARNLSLDVGKASQLIHATDDFEESHRHYSFIAVMALMSLFLLITISITGLLLGFCRKRNGSDFNSAGQTDGGSQFELDDIDVDVDTKVCKGDPHGLCYYHLSDDDIDDDTGEDNNEDGNTSVNKKWRSKEKRGRERKWKRLRDRCYYYHLHSNDDEDIWDDNRTDRSYATNSFDISLTESQCVQGLLPKRSTTFPQIHNVLTSCLGRHNSQAGNSQYELLRPACHTIHSSKGTPSSISTSLFAHHHIHHQQQHPIEVSAQVENYAAGKRAENSPDLPRSRHTHHKQQRLARNRRQSPNQLHQHKKYRPRHTQRYSSLSYHRHTRLHHVIKHTLWPTQKSLPLAGSTGGLRYKSHSIHAIPCSEPNQLLSAGTPDSPQSQVQMQVQRVAYCDETEGHDTHQWNLPVNENA